MAAEKVRALSSAETLNPKEELVQLTNEFNELMKSDEWRNRLTRQLDEWVSRLLWINWIVGKIQEVYRSMEDSKSRESLQKLLKLAKVEDDVKDEQREINVRLEALEAELSVDVRNETDELKESVKSKIESKITQLLSKGDFQGALDNAVYLLSAEDKSSAFSIVKYILKRTPASETLYIKDKKITNSKRKEWIQKMDDNMEAAAREFQSTYYQDVTIDEWSVSKTDKHSDKKAAKLLDKELTWNKDLYKISKRINVASAWALIEKNFQDIKKTFDESRRNHLNDVDDAEKEFKSKLSEKDYIKEEYLPKSGKKGDLGKKELNALTDLCAYRMLAESDDKAKSSYEALVGSQIVWASTSELEQARKVLDNVKIDSLTPAQWASEEEKAALKKRAKNTLLTLLWDLNWDGQVTNTSRVEWVDRKWLDKWTVFWGQISSALDVAIVRQWEEKVVTNIQSVINWLNWLDGFKVEPKTIEGLVAAFKNNPSALIAFRNKIKNEPDRWEWMFNLGLDYASTRIKLVDRMVKKEEEAMKEEERKSEVIGKFFETSEWKELLEQMNVAFDKKMDSELSWRVLSFIRDYKETKDFKNLDDTTQNQIKEIENMLSDDEKRKALLDSQVMKDMYKNFVISSIWASFTDINVDGQHVTWGWIWSSIMNEKLNNWLKENTSNIINRASASVGAYCMDWKVSLGLWLGFGSSTNLNNNARAYYSIWGSWSPFSPSGMSFNGVTWIETRVNTSADDSLDTKSSHYIWLAGAYGYWINFSDSSLNAHNLSLSGYWRRDKLDGVERKAEKVREKMVPIFQHLFEIDWEVTVQSILDNLRGWKMNDGTEFNWFARTSWDTLHRTAIEINNMFTSYKNKLGAENANREAIIRKLSEDFADNLAREMRNKDIEKIVDEWLYLSWANIWVSWSFANLFTWFFLSWGLTFTYYEDTEYRENQAFLEQAIKGMEDPDNYETITNLSKTYQEKMNMMNTLLGDQYLVYNPESNPESWWKEPANIVLSKEVFGRDIKVLCHPDLAPYIIQEKWVIKMPGNADVSLAQIRHQWKVENTLILGAKSSKDCEAIALDNDQLKWEWKSNVVFGSKQDEFEKYNTEIKTEIKPMKVWLDWQPNDTLVGYLAREEWSNALVNFRLSGKWKTFAKYVQSNPERWGDSSEGQKHFIDEAKSYLPESLQTVKDAEWKPVQMEFTVDDIRFIYASLSRVSQTRDKQLEVTALVSQANTYLDSLRKSLSATNISSLEKYINKVGDGGSLEKGEWDNMKRILGINYDHWESKPSISNAQKLFHILTPVKYLANKRTDAYERKIKNEYAKLGNGSKALLEARNKSLEKLNGKMTAKWELKTGWIGAVAWYDGVGDTINDKFVSSPKIISWSEVLIADSVDVKKHFLTELAHDDAAQFKAIKEKIISTLENSVNDEDKALAKEWRSDKMTNDEFINEILSAKTVDSQNNEVPRVSFNMQYAFFADCVNETILLGEINVVTTTETQIQATPDVHYYGATVTNDALTIGHSLSFWATVGKIDSKQNEKPEKPTKTEPEKEQTKTKPLSDLDQLKTNPDIQEVDFDGQEFVWVDKDWKTRYMNFVYDVDKQCYMAYDFDDDTNPCWIMLEWWGLEFYDTWKSSNLEQATEVSIQNFDDYVDQVAISKPNLSRQALNLNWQLYHMLHTTQNATERRRAKPHILKQKRSGK